MKKNRVFVAALSASLLIGAVVMVAAPPPPPGGPPPPPPASKSDRPDRPQETVSVKTHPKLADAQKAIGHAWDKVVEAKEYYAKAAPNEKSPFGGHVTKAQKLLEEANAELKLGAEAADKKH